MCLQNVKCNNKNFKFIELLESQTVKHGHMFDDDGQLTKRIYSELEGFNLVQLFNLSNGKGSNKDTMKKSKEIDQKMTKHRIETQVMLMKRSMDAIVNEDK